MPEEYDGICAACFQPIRKNQVMVRFRSKGRSFHEDCVELFPKNFYVLLEKRKAENLKRRVDDGRI